MPETIKFLIIFPHETKQLALLVTPLIRCLQQQVEGAEVHILQRYTDGPFFEHSPYVSKIFFWRERNLTELLKDEMFHYLIDLEASVRTWRIKSTLKVLDFTISNEFWQMSLFTSLKINRLSGRHFVDKCLKLVQVFDVENDNKGIDLFLNEQASVKVEELPYSLQEGYIAILLYNDNTDAIPVDTLIEICESIKKPILLLGHIGRENNIIEARKILEYKDHKLHSLLFEEVSEVLSLIRHAHVIITEYSLMMHVAGAMQKKVLTIWGSSLPEFGTGIRQAHESSRDFEVKKLKCRPCSVTAKSVCPKKHFACMLEYEGRIIGQYADEIF